ncbi:unnamed protein product [Schistocephalus solidus]|uniref:Uncharacterized protein n=1 Tax=Schistocephalus solidus TaxID=70667 RepID=A0A3P7DVR2_SCHSO|nr:unnamed protein product [Schistocephalus solidus]
MPSPRAFAKCGFVGNILYLYGGCQTYRYGLDQGARIDWLDDMYSFCTETEIWKHVKLRRASEQMLHSPPVIAGQTGTFILSSSSEDHFPAALVLFGGYSRFDGVTVNTGFVILPSLGQWFELPDSMSPTKPAGRFGHATCSLGDCRILVVGGNLRAPQPPHMGLSPSRPSRAGSGGVSSRPLETNTSSAVDGEPARDVWLLTRTECLPNQGECLFFKVFFQLILFEAELAPKFMNRKISYNLATSEHKLGRTFLEVILSLLVDYLRSYCNVSWFWTRVDCPFDGPECPPADFYHAVAVGLPLFELLGTSNTLPPDNDDNEDDCKECTSNTSGVPSASVSDRDGNVSDYFPASVVLISTATKRLISLGAGYRVQSRKRCLASRGTSDSSISPALSPLSPPSPGSSEVALHPAISPIRDCSVNLSLRAFAPAAKPLVAYTLRLSIPKSRSLPSPSDPTPLFPPKAVWLGPGKPSLGELLSAPHECLGFSLVYGFGSIFLFGGLSTASALDPKRDDVVNRVESVSGDHSIDRCGADGGIQAPPWHSELVHARQRTARSETSSSVRSLSGSARARSSLEAPALYVLHSAEFVSSLAN